MKQVCKTRKIRKTFVNLFNFCMDDAGFALGAFSDVSKSFQNTNLQSHWLSRSLFPDYIPMVTFVIFLDCNQLHILSLRVIYK